MIGNNIWPDDIREKLLHIYAQHTYHAPAKIYGSSDALRRLGEALIRASGMKQGEETNIEMMTSDGEGYGVKIQAMSDQQLDSMHLPYAQLGQMWDFERCWNCPEQNGTET